MDYHPLTWRWVTYEEMLSHLTSWSPVASSTGAHLEKLRDGVTGHKGSAGRATNDREEMQMLRLAAVSRCISGLQAIQTVRFAPCVDLAEHAKHIGMPDGEAAVRVVRAYQPRASRELRGLAEVYMWLRRHRPELADSGKGDAEALADLFRHGKEKRAQGRAVRVLADAELVLKGWSLRWNRRVSAAGVQRESAA